MTRQMPEDVVGQMSRMFRGWSWSESKFVASSHAGIRVWSRVTRCVSLSPTRRVGQHFEMCRLMVSIVCEACGILLRKTERVSFSRTYHAIADYTSSLLSVRLRNSGWPTRRLELRVDSRCDRSLKQHEDVSVPQPYRSDVVYAMVEWGGQVSHERNILHGLPG